MSRGGTIGRGQGSRVSRAEEELEQKGGQQGEGQNETEIQNEGEEDRGLPEEMTASFPLPASGISAALPPAVKGSPSSRARLSLSGHPQPLGGAAVPAVRSRTCVAATSQSLGAGAEHTHLSWGFLRGPRFPIGHPLQLRSSQGPPSKHPHSHSSKNPSKAKTRLVPLIQVWAEPWLPRSASQGHWLKAGGRGEAGRPKKTSQNKDRGAQRMFKNQGGLSAGSWPSCWTPPPAAQGEGDISLEESILQTVFAGNKQTA